ncbi:hypothetical protein GGX14DRAFT_606737 [Mycena pura]|uniref:Uncharacterized protein n=1 Tax=Mycena pura TaxID=153505 RepID=A0AAD6VM23_9AGAR|nr:hypothetical protein GGX14DRAFT_606737 [Mycena pura]
MAGEILSRPPHLALRKLASYNGAYNSVRIRLKGSAQFGDGLQWDKNMLSAHIPAHIFEHPTHVGGLDCRVRVPREAVELREYLTEEVGSTRREKHLGWPGLTAEFDRMAQAAFEALGQPTLSLDSAWGIFAQMSTIIEDLLDG